MLLGVVDADVRHAVQKRPLQREPRVFAWAEAQRQAAPGAHRQHRGSGQRKAQRHADFGRGVAELEGDRVPGRAPGEHAEREELPGPKPLHQSKAYVAWPLRPVRNTRSTPSMITAFMPKVSAPSMRASAR